jgi:nitrogen fixation NifU-like protein
MHKLTRDERQLLKDAGYSRNVLELYINQVNEGAIENPETMFAYTGPCGDTIHLYLKISRENVIENARFQYVGCPASAVCGSIITQLILGKSLHEAMEITPSDVLSEADGLPDEERHCAQLVITTLRKTIANYQGNDYL